jgi:hypothetical protein
MLELRKSLLGKYLALRSLVIKVPGQVRSFQASLPSIALLKAVMLLKPKPPAFLCIANRFQESQ